MYIPDYFQIHDPETIAEFMRKHSFATIVTYFEHSSFATHMPVLLERRSGPYGTLVSHLARANPQARHFENGQEALIIFQGPHAYVSPSWYTAAPAVPTWNYTAVHAYGIPRLITDPERLITLLRDLVEYFEAPRSDRWSGEMPEDYRDRMIKGLVGVEMEITRVEAKYKLSQNRQPEDRDRVAEALRKSSDQTERETGEMMVRRENGMP